MNDIIIDTLVEKVNSHETRIDEQQKTTQEMSTTISAMKGESENIQRIAKIVDELQAKMVNIQWPVSEMEKLSGILSRTNHLLENPRREKVLHVHTGSKMMWSVIALSVICIFLLAGWISTYNRLNDYRMNDVCWQYLKLNLGAKQVQSMQKLEMQYQQHPDEMTAQVEQQELRLQQWAEARQKAIEAETRAREYRKAAGDSLIMQNNPAKNKSKLKTKPSK
jgi:hypothetical protein